MTSTFRVLRTRIDQFGVAQPNINPDGERGIITVELPGIQDQERVRKYLQSTANLQFWEVYNISELFASIEKPTRPLMCIMGGATTDTTAQKRQRCKKPDSSVKIQVMYFQRN